GREMPPRHRPKARKSGECQPKRKSPHPFGHDPEAPHPVECVHYEIREVVVNVLQRALFRDSYKFDLSQSLRLLGMSRGMVLESEVVVGHFRPEVTADGDELVEDQIIPQGPWEKNDTRCQEEEGARL